MCDKLINYEAMKVAKLAVYHVVRRFKGLVTVQIVEDFDILAQRRLLMLYKKEYGEF